MRRPSRSAVGSLREFFTGAAIRTIAGIRDVGEVLLAKIENQSDSGTVTNTDGDADVWVTYTDMLSGQPGVGRLFIPGNVLFALPTDQDSCIVIRPRDSHGPGINYVVHGDAGDASRVPPWAIGSTPKDGLFTRRALRLESKDLDVEVVPEPAHKVYVGAASGGGTQPAVLGNDLNAYLGQMRDRINALEDLLADFIVKFNTASLPVSGGSAGPPATPESGTVPGHMGDPPALAANVEVK